MSVKHQISLHRTTLVVVGNISKLNILSYSQRKEWMEARHSALLETIKMTETPDDKEGNL